MRGVTHKKAAIGTAAASAVFATASTLSFAFDFKGITMVPILWIPLSFLGGYASDIDKGRTTARNWFLKFFRVYSFLVIASVITILVLNRNLIVPMTCIVASYAGLVLIYALIKMMKHRRETHSFSFVAIWLLFSWLIYGSLWEVNHIAAVVAGNLAFGFAIGVMSHMIVDEFNIKPMHWFFPLEIVLQKIFKRKRPVIIIPTIVKIKTKSPLENVFIKVYLGVIFLLAISIPIAIKIIAQKGLIG